MAVCRTAVRGSKPRRGARMPLKHKWTCICLVNRWLPVRGRRAAPVDGHTHSLIGRATRYNRAGIRFESWCAPARENAAIPPYGPVAQPGARRNGIAEAAGSNPAGSTIERQMYAVTQAWTFAVILFFFLFGRSLLR